MIKKGCWEGAVYRFEGRGARGEDRESAVFSGKTRVIGF
jgi:hypothetical protein